MKCSANPKRLQRALSQACQDLMSIAICFRNIAHLIQKFLAYMEGEHGSGAHRRKPFAASWAMLNFIGIRCFNETKELCRRLESERFWQFIGFLLLATWPMERLSTHVYKFDYKYHKGVRPKFCVTLSELNCFVVSVQLLLMQFYKCKGTTIQWWKRWVILWQLCDIYSHVLEWIVTKFGQVLGVKSLV